MTTISVTERRTYKRCRQLWDFNSVLSLEPAIKAPALELGTLVHHPIGDWMMDPSIDIIKRYNQYADESVSRIIDFYRQAIGIPPQYTEMRAVLEAIQLGEAMIKNYKAYYKTSLYEDFECLGAEQTLIVDIPGTEHCGCQLEPSSINVIRESGVSCECFDCFDVVLGKCILCIECDCIVRHRLEGTFDGLLLRKKSNQLFIKETKTFSRHPTLESLERDDQFLGYTWLAQTALKQQVGGIAYDGLWKRAAVPDKKTMDDMFLRKLLHRGQHELELFEVSLAQEANEMANSPAIYRNIPWNGCEGLSGCHFKSLCDAKWVDNTYDQVIGRYTQRPEKYPGYALGDSD